MPEISDKKDGMKSFDTCTCLLAVSDRLYMKSLREMLYSMNIGKIETCTDGAQAIFKLRQIQDVDIVIAQEDLPISQCIDIVRFVRSDRKWPKPNLPIISIGWKWTQQKIELYRDAGIDDVLVFPSSQYAMQRRIVSALCSERPLISTDLYRGPDRRRKDTRGYQGPFRRNSDTPFNPGEAAETVLAPPTPAISMTARPSSLLEAAMSQAELQQTLSKNQKDKGKP